MKALVSISGFVFCLTMFAACLGDDSNSKLEDKEDLLRLSQLPHQIIINADTASFSIQKKILLEDGSKNYQKKGLTQIALSFPYIDSFVNPSIKDSINILIQKILLENPVSNLAFNNVEERMQEFIMDYKVHKIEMKKFGLPIPTNWFCEMTIEVLLNSPLLMSMRIHKLEFTGGAHANPWTNYLNIGLQSGMELTLDDLLIENYETQLLMAAEIQFKKTYNLAQDSNLLEHDFVFSSGDFMLPQKFSVGKNGIAFHYNPYELGPFALGAVSFEIPYRDILSLVNRDVIKLEAVSN